MKTDSTNKTVSLGLKPLAGYVLVEPSAADTQTASGIYLPETAQEKPAQGTVMAVGAPSFEFGREVFPPVNVGDKVIYKKWGGDEIKLSGKEYKLVKFDDLMGILE
jgi:chaperonin GroES